MTTITPILLCGGAGTRLWPVSRKGHPKQFGAAGGGDSLFRQALARLSGPGFAAPVIATAEDYRFVAAGQTAGLPPPAAILLEPFPRNTAPAVMAAVLHVARRDPQALVLVAPCDHAIPDGAAFRDAVRAAAPAALGGRIVTFGIVPTRAETGYGWLELDGDPAAHAPVPLRRFVEKPGAEAAARMLAGGRHLWNAGCFLFAADTLVAAARRQAPDILSLAAEALAGAVPDLGFLRLAPGPWARARAVSIDVAVMEGATNLSVMPFAGRWSDLGDWEAMAREGAPDPQGNILQGSVTAMDCGGSVLRSEEGGPDLVAIGLTDLLAVATPDAVLVAHRSRAQEVGQAVAALRRRGARSADAFPRDHRPWGWFDRLVAGDGFQVKRIHVNPGAALSLQSHAHRAEHWVVVAGTARVTVGATVSLLAENQSAYIPRGTRHRLENPGNRPAVLIEVQTGPYLGEDDITRYADAYARA